MNRDNSQRRAGFALTLAAFWVISAAIGFAVYTDMGVPTAAQAANPCNPCNPCNPRKPGKQANPCNPCKPGKQANPCNPCNPCEPGKQANPCNPCNPCAAKKSANPCNPCNAAGGGASTTGARLSIGADYQSGKFEKTTGYVPSASHGDRLVVSWVFPAAAAKIYRENAEKVRNKQVRNMKSYPVGTTIVKESFMKQANGSPGARGPVFVMKKEQPAYDASGGNWRYVFTQPDMMEIGNGFTGPVAFCKACHMTMKDQDFVFAVDR